MAFTTGTRYMVACPNSGYMTTTNTEAEAIAIAEGMVDDMFPNVHIIPCLTVSNVEE